MKIHRFAIPFGLTWLFFAPATAAPAQGNDDAEATKAAVRFQQGVELYREGSYEGALAEFRKAYQISPSYRVLYNIAQTQYALHDFVGAYKSLVQYASEGGAEITAERRAQVDEMSARLGERIAHLQIATNVTGADLRVDDVSVGISPLAGPVAVNVGTRKVSAVKAGFPPAVRVLTVAGRESVKVELHVDENVAAPRSGPANSPVPAIGESAPPAGLPAGTIAKAQTAAAPGRAGLAVSLSVTAALAVGTGICGFLALRAQQQLKDQLNTYPTTKATIDDARSKSKNYGYLTDAMGAATLVSGGVALYFALAHGGDVSKPKPHASIEPVVLAPTAAGMVVQGSF